jgi:hypothetical protein
VPQAGLSVENDGGPSLFLCDAQNKLWGGMSVSAAGPGFVLSDSRSSAVIAVKGTRGPSVTLVNASRKKLQLRP